MYFYHNNSVAWIKIPKNACSSWEAVFTQLSWQKEDLLNPSIDISELVFFGFLQNPYIRHAKGITQYVIDSSLLDLLDSKFNKLLVSGVFDEHTMSVSHLVPPRVIENTTFFVIDHLHFDYELLVREFLKDYGVVIPFPIPRLNASNEQKKYIYEKVIALKEEHIDEFNKLAKNFLERDVNLYAKHLALQHHWDKPRAA